MIDSTSPARSTSRNARWQIAGWCVAALTTLGAAGSMAMAPEPDPVPQRWELQVDPGELRLTTIEVPNLGPRKYFYMTYRVTNNSGKDLLFAPSFEMSDGEGGISRSGRDVPLTVTQKVLGETQNVFIQDQISIIGELLQGSENSRDGVVIWPAANLSPDEVIVYAAGFSGETATVTGNDGKTKYVLRKTLRLDFVAPGDLAGVATRGLTMNGRSWIMR